MTWDKFIHVQEVICLTSTKFVTGYKCTSKVALRPICVQQQQQLTIKQKIYILSCRTKKTLNLFFYLFEILMTD